MVKSRRIASARAAAAGPGILVFVRGFGARPRRPCWGISRPMRLRSVGRPVAQLGMDPWRAIPARGSLVLSLGRDEQTGVLAVPVRGLPASDGVVHGTGYLQQLARPCWHSSTTRALNSGVNERRRRGFCPMLSMIGHPSGHQPVMMDVRQSGSGPPTGSRSSPLC